MQVTETGSEGLSRQFKVVIAAAELDERLDKRLKEMAPQVRLNGFRPGKVPVAFLKKTYGKSMMGEIMQEAVNETSQQAITERELRAATQPRIEVESSMDDVVAGKADLSFTVDVDIMPEFEPADVKTLTLEQMTVEVADADIDKQIEELASGQRSYKARAETAKAETEDQLTIDFEGSVDGELFEGGTAEDAKLVLGSGQFIPGFEEQLEGTKAGDELDVNVTFPEEYGVDTLAGKAAVFKVKVKEVAEPEATEINDELAKNFGLESLDKLKEAVRDNIGRGYEGQARSVMKRHILDKLDDLHSFDLPLGMVDTEFNQIWSQVEANLEEEMKTEGKSEDELKEDYKKIAQRRIRLGLVLAEIGRQGNIEVTQEELARAMQEQASRYPGQEQAVFKFYRENPQAFDQLRAPLYEEKTIDYIREMATVENKSVSKDELNAAIAELDGSLDGLGEAGQADVGGHDHDHDHEGHDHNH